ncbi:cell envelope integrity protein TolA, partial [Candidatus Babeliales bacterium]|nr:cell envelope integrity protein TolA [Candidatus Babeliales bacterium]
MPQSLSAGFLWGENTVTGMELTAQVLTSENRFVSINKICAGTYVKSLGFGGSITTARVTKTARHEKFLVRYLFFNTHNENPQILVLDVDQVLCGADGRWIIAQEIKIGTKLLGLHGDVTVTDVAGRCMKPGECLQESYSIELEEKGGETPHSYFVKGATCPDSKAILAHNGIPSEREYQSSEFDGIRAKHDYLTLFPQASEYSSSSSRKNRFVLGSSSGDDWKSALTISLCTNLASRCGSHDERRVAESIALDEAFRHFATCDKKSDFSANYSDLAQAREKAKQFRVAEAKEAQEKEDKERVRLKAAKEAQEEGRKKAIEEKAKAKAENVAKVAAMLKAKKEAQLELEKRRQEVERMDKETARLKAEKLAQEKERQETGKSAQEVEEKEAVARLLTLHKVFKLLEFLEPQMGASIKPGVAFGEYLNCSKEAFTSFTKKYGEFFESAFAYSGFLSGVGTALGAPGIAITTLGAASNAHSIYRSGGAAARLSSRVYNYFFGSNENIVYDTDWRQDASLLAQEVLPYILPYIKFPKALTKAAMRSKPVRKVVATCK